MNNFMLKDFVQLTLAFLVFPLFTVIPGYVISWWGNILDFRRRRVETRILIGVGVSISVLPIFDYLIAKLLSFDLAIFLYIPLWAFFVLHFYKNLRLFRFSISKWEFLAIGATALWLFVAIVSLIDLQIGGRLYYSVISFDHATRVALTDSILRNGIPAINPTFYPGQSVYISYFYFWSLVCAFLSKLSNQLLDARISFYAGILWVGVALRAIAALYIRLFYPGDKTDTGKRVAIAVSLFFVTGLDFIFAIITMFRIPGYAFATEWWNGNAQVTAWIGATLWVPHHVASLVACLTSFAIFRAITPDTPIVNKIVALTVAGAGYASSIGLSVYVTLIFVVAQTVWFFHLLLLRQMWQKALWLFGAGVIAVGLASPFLYEVFSMQQSIQQGFPIALWVRPFEPLRVLILGYGWNTTLANVIYFLALPINYLLEFGFFLLAGVIYLSKYQKQHILPSDRLAPDLLLLVSSFVICTFFRSVTIGNNDLGWRGLMPAQFILLVWSVEIVLLIFPKFFEAVASSLLSPFLRRSLILLFVFGLISTSVDLLYLRSYFLINDFTSWFPIPAEGRPDRFVGERTLALREAYHFIDSTYLIGITVENNPRVEVLDRAQGLYSHRQIVADGPGIGIEVYGLSRSEYESLVNQIYPLFESSALNTSQVLSLCERLSISLLIVKDTDPVWKQPNGWVWKTPPVFYNKYVRVYECK